MAGILFVVATPIGNLEDITLRALRILREVRLIAAEDTRRTARLLSHYRIATPTTSLHEHNERRKIPGLLARLVSGDDVAVVTDAGTPTVSDPGALLIQAAHERGIRVEAIPGPSAILTALAASGLPTATFTFMGFPPAKARERSEWLRSLARERRPVVFFEAPHRIRKTLTQAADILGDRQIILAREMTKIHEELVKGPISETLRRLEHPKGEFTIVLEPASQPHGRPAVELDDHFIYSRFGQLMESTGLGRAECIGALADELDIPRNQVYRAVERARKSVE